MNEIREIKGFVRSLEKESFTDALTNENIMRSILRFSYKDDGNYQHLLLGKNFKTQEEFRLEPEIHSAESGKEPEKMTIIEIEKDDSINCYHEIDGDDYGNYFLKDNHFVIKEMENAL